MIDTSQHVSTEAVHTTKETVLFQPKQNSETAVKCFSCFSQSRSVSTVQGLARKQWIYILWLDKTFCGFL